MAPIIIKGLTFIDERGNENSIESTISINNKVITGISLEKIFSIYGIDIRNDIDDFYRLRNPPIIKTEDGHLVRSRAEVLIDNWLFSNGISHSYEKRVPGKHKIYTDFYFNKQDLYIEYWGGKDEEYLRRRKFKEGVYREQNLNLFSIEDEDIPNLYDKLHTKIEI